MPKNCASCVHKRSQKQSRVFCSYWAEHVSKYHCCIMHENEGNDFIKALSFKELEAFKRMERADYLNVLKQERPDEYKDLFVRIEKFRNSAKNAVGQPLINVF